MIFKVMQSLQNSSMHDVHAQVTHAERDDSTGLWRLQTKAAGAGSPGTAALAYSGIILADPMVAAKGRPFLMRALQQQACCPTRLDNEWFC